MAFKTNNWYLKEIAEGIGSSATTSTEIRDGATDARANVSAANTARTTATNVLAVQHVDAAGNVLPASPVLGAGSAIVGNVRIDQTTPGTTNAVQLSGAALTIVVSTVTTNGSVAAGKKNIEFEFSDDFAGTIATVAYDGTEDAYKSFEAPPGHTFAALAYTISAGSARLTTF